MAATITQATGSSEVSRDGQTWAVIDSGGGGEMSISAPATATYLVTFSGSFTGTPWNTTKETVDIALFGNGTIYSHTVRRFAQEDSWHTAARWTMETHAIISVSGSQAIDVRWKTSVSGQTGYCYNRVLTIVPVSTYIEKYATSQTSTSTTDYSVTLLTPDSNPAANDYVMFFSSSAEQGGTANERIGIRYYQGGSFSKTWTYREHALEGSFEDADVPIYLTCMIDPNGSQDCDIRWASAGAGGTIYCNERTMILVPPETYCEVYNSTASSATNTSWALINSMSISAGTPPSGVSAGTWFALYTMNTDFSTFEDSEVDYSLYEGSTRQATCDRRNSNDGSLSAGWVCVAITGVVTIESSEALEAWWQNSTSTSRDAVQRCLTAFQMPSTAAVDQYSYRWRDDDGSETGATWLQNEGVNITRPKNTNTRLRTLIDASGDPASQQYQLEFREKGSGDPWKKIDV